MVFVGSVLQTAASVASELASRQRVSICGSYGRSRTLQSSQVGTAHAANSHAELPAGLFHPRGEQRALQTRGGRPQSPPRPRGPWVLGSEQVYCMLSWPKLHEAGQQAGEMTLRGGEGKLLEVPWPQVTASELRPMTSIHSQLVGGVVVKAIKGNENSKHLAKMSPWVKRGLLPGRARMRMGLCECRKLGNWRGLFYDTFQ